MGVRQAGREDARAVASMLSAFNTEFDTWVPEVHDLERRFEALLASDHAVVVMSEGPDPNGFALVALRPSPYYDGPVAALDEMYVAPARRGQGRGTAIMTLLLHLLRERACGEVQINVDEHDAGARRFYERHGFTHLEPDSAEQMLCYIREL